MADWVRLEFCFMKKTKNLKEIVYSFFHVWVQHTLRNIDYREGTTDMKNASGSASENTAPTVYSEPLLYYYGYYYLSDVLTKI